MEGGTVRTLLYIMVNEHLQRKKNLTPIDFRQIVPSLIFDDEVNILGQEPETFLSNYVGLINTSQRVMKEHCICFTTRKKQVKVLQTIEDQIYDTPKSKDLKRKLELQDQIHNKKKKDTLESKKLKRKFPSKDQISNKKKKIVFLSSRPLMLLKIQYLQMENVRLKRLLKKKQINF